MAPRLRRYEKLRIVTNPQVCFGAYHFEGSRLTVNAIVSRFIAGEPAAEIANDMDITVPTVEAALRWAIEYRRRG